MTKFLLNVRLKSAKIFLSSKDLPHCFQELEDAFEELKNSSITRSRMLNIRSKLGYILYQCCLTDFKVTFYIAEKIIQNDSPSIDKSIIYIAILSYIYQFIPKEEEHNFILPISDDFISHSQVTDEEFSNYLTKYLNAGGLNKIPCILELLNQLFQNITTYNMTQICPIALIINKSPDSFSAVFWCHVSQFDIDSIINMLKQVLPITNLEIPSNYPEILELIEEKAIEMSRPENSFNVIETSLIIIRWLVNNKIIKFEDLNLKYENPSLNLIVLSIWADFAKFGNLNSLPQFEKTNSKPVNQIYAQMFVNSVQNPTCSIKESTIPHWIVDSIKNELIGIESTTHPSILTLSIDELDVFAEIANILPKWFYVHVLRARVKNSDFQLRLIRIVRDIPIRIFEAYVDDFFDFVIWCLRFSSLCSDLEDLLQNLACFYYSNVDKLIEKVIDTLDYFNETNIMTRLNILSILVRFTEKYVCEPIFDTIWELIPTMQLSISLVSSIIKFCDSLAFNSQDIQDKIITIVMSPLLVYLKQTDFVGVEDSPQLSALISAIQTFYSVISSDIVVNPQYTFQDSYPLNSLAMSVLIKLNLPQPVFNFIVNHLEALHMSAQTQTAAFIFRHLNEISPTVLQNISKPIAQYFTRGLGDKAYSVIMCLLTKSNYFASCRGSTLGAISELPDDSNLVRLILFLSLNTKPLLAMKPSMLFILLEKWLLEKGEHDEAIITALKNCAVATKAWRHQRLYRAFLFALDIQQPPSKSPSGHFSADFLCKNLDPEDPNEILKSSNITDAISLFSSHFPGPVENSSEQEVVAAFVKMYRRDPRTHQLLVHLTKLLGDKVSNVIGVSRPMLRFSRSIGINRVILSPSTPFCKQVACRLGQIECKDFLVESIIAKGKKSDDILNEDSSVFLAAQFVDASSSIVTCRLAFMTNVDSVKIKALTHFPNMDQSIRLELIQTTLVEEVISSLDPSIPTVASAFYHILNAYDSGQTILGKYATAILQNIVKSCNQSSAILSLLSVKCLSVAEKIDSYKVRKGIIKLLSPN